MKSHSKALKAAPTEAQRATYVAWLLRIDPFHVFPIERETTPEADQHLVDHVIAELEKQNELAAHFSARSPRAMWFRLLLNHCNKVMSGAVNPAKNGWFNNKRGYRRGIYVFQEAAE